MKVRIPKCSRSEYFLPSNAEAHCFAQVEGTRVPQQEFTIVLGLRFQVAKRFPSGFRIHKSHSPSVTVDGDFRPDSLSLRVRITRRDTGQGRTIQQG